MTEQCAAPPMTNPDTPVTDEAGRVDLDALEAMLAKATRGRWCKFDSVYGNGSVSILLNDQTNGKPIIHWQGFDGSDTTKAKRHANAELIAAMHEALPALIAELRASRTPAASNAGAGYAAAIEAALNGLHEIKVAADNTMPRDGYEGLMAQFRHIADTALSTADRMRALATPTKIEGTEA